MVEPLDLNLLLQRSGIDVSHSKVLVMRHRPTEPELQRILPWWAEEQPQAFNAYQSTQNPMAESALLRADYLASFIAHQSDRALFVGLYRRVSSTELSKERYDSLPIELKQYSTGLRRMMDEGQAVQFFDLESLIPMSDLKGRLIVDWTTPRAWYRWADRNRILVRAIAEESKLVKSMPPWDQLTLRWEELHALPSSWRAALQQWRGVYYIFDTSDQQGYVGSAYGAENILGRWLNYLQTRGGGNVRLEGRNPKSFKFSILQRVSPDLEPDAVVAIETSWKVRLHTKDYGLNAN
ncbi:MAG: GIY-YIG nuclease family protein [Rhodospirillaceae bacterium]|nr:GIY-YIG nuclease family protein [Rhodospirillaceae bacterium]